MNYVRQCPINVTATKSAQQSIRLLGQALLWVAPQNIHFPYPSNGRMLTSFEWGPIRYRNVVSNLKNPFYAGVYAYG
jgi:hypothetical protein